MEEKNTNVSQTEENPEQNSPEISAENESTLQLSLPRRNLGLAGLNGLL